MNDELLEQLTLYVLGLLEPEEASVVDRHLSQGCTACQIETAELRETMTACLTAHVEYRQAPPNLRDRVLAVTKPAPFAKQVWRRWDTPLADLHVVRRGQGDWETVAPGVTARRLFADREHDSVTMMIRMEPGARYAPHRHAGPEQCYVLEGDLFDGAQTFHAGDFQCAAKDSVHGVQSTENGCLLLIVSSMHDELLA
jgi:anti-sigma factor ChrR (cupin superfamily)